MRKYLELSSQSEYLGPLLDEWMNLYAEACQHFPQGGNDYYLEQTLTALLVSAGWRVGVPAVSEARILRRNGRDKSNGRADVLLKVSSAVTAIEAKIHWFNDSGGFAVVMQRLREACEQAAAIDSEDVQKRLGLCCGVIERGSKPVEELLEESVLTARQKRMDILGYSTVSLTSESTNYPGYLMLGRFVD